MSVTDELTPYTDGTVLC